MSKAMRKCKVVKARKGNVKMLHYPAGGGYSETTIVYSNKIKVQVAKTNISEYEMNCEYCWTGGPYSTNIGLMYYTPEKALNRSCM